MKLRFSNIALNDLEQIQDYIAMENPIAAEHVVSAILTTCYQLEDFPFLGTKGRIEDTREIVVPRVPYIIVYTIDEPYYVDIETILHTRKEYPKLKE